MIFLGPVYVGERVEISAEVTYVGRTSIETRIEIFAEPIEVFERRKVAVGYALYVALDETGRRPRPVPPLLIDTEAGRRAAEAGQARQKIRLARRAEARGPGRSHAACNSARRSARASVNPDADRVDIPSAGLCRTRTGDEAAPGSSNLGTAASV